MSVPRWLVAVAAIGIAALAAASFLFGRLSLGPTPAAPGAVDVGFSRDMAVHHQQAVLMSELLRDRATDEELRAIAIDMALTQTSQAGQMQGWLGLWGEPLAVEGPPMTWMAGHADHGAQEPMAGLASQSDLNALAASTGVDAERRYLTLMIPHHQAGVEMARYALDHAAVPAVRTLAGAMVRAQTTEVQTLQKFLDARGGPLR